MEKKAFSTTEYDFGKRIDVFLSEKTGYSRSHIKKLCDEGFVCLNDKIVKNNKIIKQLEEYFLTIPDDKQLDIMPKNIPIDIVYQDDDIAVINKAQGMTVHAGNGTKGETLVNALLYHLDHLSGINGVVRPGIVHRIDKNTSGLLVVAKNDKAHISLARQLEDKTCNRTYYALLEGIVKDDCGHIETFISRSDRDRTKMSVSGKGRLAITDYNVIKRYKNYTFCEFKLKTGRTHQIRLHAKYIGHPIVGDKEYGYKNQKFKLNGQLLHAGKLEFLHPTSNKIVSFECDLPDYFKEILNKIN